MAVNPGVHVEMEFALPHAINLAEAGQRIQDKRTGMLVAAASQVMLQFSVQDICSARK